MNVYTRVVVDDDDKNNNENVDDAAAALAAVSRVVANASADDGHGRFLVDVDTTALEQLSGLLADELNADVERKPLEHYEFERFMASHHDEQPRQVRLCKLDDDGDVGDAVGEPAGDNPPRRFARFRFDKHASQVD